MKTTVFTINNNNNNNANYSKILDNIILDTMMKNNSYLFEDTEKKTNDAIIDAMFDDIDNTCIYHKILKGDDKFTKACEFLANYGKKKTFSIPYKLNKLYRLSDGTAIIFYDDEIQIGEDTYKYSDFDDFDFINGLTPEKKKIIVNIKIKL